MLPRQALLGDTESGVSSRANAVKARSSVGRPITGLSPVSRRTGFKAWPTDDRLGTFILTRGEEPPLRDDLCYVTALDAPEENSLGDTNAERKVSPPLFFEAGL